MKNSFLSELLTFFCIFALGICLTIWADKVTDVGSIFLGILAIVYGIIVFVNYFRNKKKVINDRLSFLFGIVILVIGFVLVIRTDFLKELISFIIGIYVILTSSFKLCECISIMKKTKTKMTTSIILSSIGIFVGLLCILGKLIIPNVIVSYIGILIIIYSIVSIINLFILDRK